MSLAEVSVPEVIGLAHEQALDVLSQATLVPDVRFAPEVSPPGSVISANPAPGQLVSVASIVKLLVSGARPIPEPDTGPDAGWSRLSFLIGAYPEVFVGLYFRQGTPVIVFNPEVDMDLWQPRLVIAADGHEYRTKSCPVSLTQLRQVQVRLGLREWTARTLGIGFGVEPATCSVGLHAPPLVPSEREELEAMFGDLVTIYEDGGVVPM